MIVPIFIPNQGCGHRCVFCEQESITSQAGFKVGKDHVRKIVEQALASPSFSRSATNEVAFYGGTFTCLPVPLIEELLGAVAPYLERGLFSGIRISTRPDSVDGCRCALLANGGVRTVELGGQSMNDRVLALSGRGHSASETAKAAKLLKEHGFKVGIQLMPGLPGDTRDIFSETVSAVIDLRPHMVRIYPAIVIRGTRLAGCYLEGGYRPLCFEEAIEWCQDACIRLEAEGIPVIRIGLMNTPSLREPGRILAGPWHEAFGHLVRSGIYRKKIAALFPAGRFAGRDVIIKAPPG